MALGFNLSEEGAALGGAQHVKEGVLGQAQPTDRAAPVVVHGTEGRPCPSKLVQRLNEAPHGPSPPERLDLVLQLLGQSAHRGVSINLAPEPKEGFPLDDGVNFKSVAGHANSHKGPELNPLVAFGPNGGFEGMVVGCLDRSRWCLDVRASSAHAGGQRSCMAGFGEHGGRETSNAWEAEGSSLDASIGGGGEVERG